MVQHRDAGHTRSSLFEELQAFTRNGTSRGQPCDVPTGPCQAGDEACLYRLPHFRHNDRNGRSRLHGRTGCRDASRGHDHLDGQLDQLSRECRQSVEPALHVAACQDEVLSCHIAQLTEPLQKHGMQVLFVSPPTPF